MSARKMSARMTDSSDDTLGGRLSAARDSAGLSLADVANRIGVRKESLLSWEADRAEPRAAKLVDIAGILGVSPMWLMTGLGSGPLEEGADLPLEALRLQLQRLTAAHQECGRLIADIGRQIDRYEARSTHDSGNRSLEGPVMGRA
jgi:transcriptional regulator with XRE-family HTH domain